MNRKALLNNLLETLVREWGPNEVQSSLSKLVQSNEKVGPISDSHKSKPQKIKLSAVELVAREALLEWQSTIVRDLAVRFDRKQFLPSISDIRELMVMMGESPATIKDRADAFRILLRTFRRLPQEKLERIANSAKHSGPSQLGPLSDAISAAGASITRRWEPSEH